MVVTVVEVAEMVGVACAPLSFERVLKPLMYFTSLLRPGCSLKRRRAAANPVGTST